MVRSGGKSSMRRPIMLAILALSMASCAPSSQEMVRQYNEDGVLLYERGEYGLARQSFEAAQKLAPDDAAVLYNLAECHERLGDPARAETLYRECLTRSP